MNDVSSAGLSSFMVLGAPIALDNMSAGFHFDRRKLIDVPWMTMLSRFVDKETAASLTAADPHIPGRYLQRHFLKSWKAIGTPDRGAMLTGNQVFVPDLAKVVAISDAVLKQIREKRFPIRVEGITARRVPRAEQAVPLNDDGTVCVLRMPTATLDRYFLPFGRSLQGKVEYFKDDALFDAAHSGHEEAWVRVRGLMQVFVARDVKPESIAAATKEALTFFSAIDEVDAAAAHIVLEWNRYQAKSATAVARRTAADGMLAAALKEMTTVEGWAEIADRYVHLASSEELLGMSDVLRDRAAALRYELVTAKTTVEHLKNDGTKEPITLEPGALYYKYPQTASWWTTHHNGYTFFGLKKKKPRRVPHTQVYQYYERVKPDFDPWMEAAAQYQAEGYEVSLMKSTPEGYVAEDGRGLADIMELCLRDESYRRRCVVGIPTLEETLSGRQIVRSYRFYFRPLPALLPSEPPSLTVNEQLTYRFAWKGARLGELAANIPMAPGEERSVTITRNVMKENSRSESSGSIVELNTVTRQDFEATFESEITREAEKTRTMSAEASGSYGGMVSGGASFSQTQRTKDVARTLNRAVQRASSEVTSKRRQEVTVSMSESIKESLSDATSYKVSNINSGRTLNILIFRLMNEYESALYLDDFSCVVEAGPELIEGTGLRDRRTFRRTPAEMQALAEYLAQMQYGFDVDEKRRSELAAAVTYELRKAITDDYDVEAPESKGGTSGDSAVPSGANSVTKTGLEIAMLSQDEPRFPLLRINTEFLSRLTSVAAGNSATVLRTLATEHAKMEPSVARELDMRILAAYEGTGRPIVQKMTFAYDSGALYADCRLGECDGLEDYALRMRELEAGAKSAEIELTRGRAALLVSAAGLPPAQPQGSGTALPGKVLARFGRWQGQRVFLTFIVSGTQLPDMGWRLQDSKANFVKAADDVSRSPDGLLILFALSTEETAPYVGMSDKDLFARCELSHD